MALHARYNLRWDAGALDTCCRASMRHLAPAAVASRSCQRRQLPCLVRAFDLDALDLDMPDIDGDLRSVQQECGATFNAAGVPLTFGNARQAVAALESGVVLVDRSHWGRLRVAGDDRANFLHSQSTNDFLNLRPGQGCDTVFVTATARAIDLATALVSENSILVVVSPTTKEAMMQRMDKYIFPADKVTVQDISERCSMLSILGPEADKILQEIAGEAVTVIGKPYGTHQLLKFRTGPVILAVGGGLATPGYTLIADESVAGELYSLLASKGCVLMGEDEWEIARVKEGRPAVGTELTEDYNPLEAGLSHAVSVNKGCYIGQETLAKVAGRNAAKQQLWGLSLSAAAPVGAEVRDTVGGARVGRVTSSAVTPDGKHLALAYLRSRDATGAREWEGAQVVVGDVQAQVVAIPFATRTILDELPKDMAGPGADAKLKAAQQERLEAAEKAKAEAAAKAERLRAMQERLAAYQASLQPKP